MRKHPIVRPLLTLSTGIYRSPWYCLAGVPSDAPCHSRHQKFTCTCCARSVHAGVVCVWPRDLVACAVPMHTLPECIWACAARYRHVGALSGEVSAVCYSRGTLGTPGTRRALGAACKWDGDVR